MGSLEHAKTELFDMATLKWKKSTSYFDYQLIYSFAAFFYQEKFHVVGGKTEKRVLSVVATFNPLTEKWNQIGNLKYSRHNHKVELLDDKVFIIGGSEIPEYCDLNDGFTCSMFSDVKVKHDNNPRLYAFYPSKCRIADKSMRNLDYATLRLNELSKNLKNETTETDESKTEKVYSSGSSVMALGTQPVYTGFMICEDWALSVDLKLTNQSTTKWRKVFSLQNDGSSNLPHGSRIPAVWVRPDQSNVMLMVAYSIKTNPTFTFNITTKFNTGNWINLKISQINGIYEVKVDYRPVYRVSSSIYNTWNKVNLAIGDTYGTLHLSAVGYYRNFDIITCKRKTLKYSSLN